MRKSLLSAQKREMSCHPEWLKAVLETGVLSPFPLSSSEPGVMQPAGKAISISALANELHSLKQDEPIFASLMFRTDK